MPAQTYLTTVEGIKEESPSVYTLIVKAPERITFEPGQFFFVYLQKEGKRAAKAYSVASLPNSNILEFCIKRVEGGYASNSLHSLKKGDTLEISGPYGFFTLKEVTRQTVFLATGTGISAIRPMIHTLFQQGTTKEIWLLFGVKMQEDILYRQEFENLAKKHKNFHFIPVLSKEEWNSHKGRIQDVLWKVIKNPDADYYVCGLFPMVDEVKQLLLTAGIDKERIYIERYV